MESKIRCEKISKLVEDAMCGKGIIVSNSDLPEIIDYLNKNHSSLTFTLKYNTIQGSTIIQKSN